MQPKDKLGQTIQAGDLIAYAIRAGNSSALRVYEVLELEEKDRRYTEFKVWVAKVREIRRKGWRSGTDRPYIRHTRATSVESLRTHAVRIDVKVSPGKPGDPVTFKSAKCVNEGHLCPC